jgi:hypothetical protein
MSHGLVANMILFRIITIIIQGTAAMLPIRYTRFPSRIYSNTVNRPVASIKGPPKFSIFDRKNLHGRNCYLYSLDAPNANTRRLSQPGELNLQKTSDEEISRYTADALFSRNETESCENWGGFNTRP